MPKAGAQSPRSGGSSGDATRARLTDAAATLVVERGWGSVTTRAVAERAGVNQALVHYHFGNMEGLLREAVLSRLLPVLRGLADELLDERPFADGIHGTMRLLDDFDLGSDTGVLMAEALLRATRDEQMAEAMGGMVGSWTAMLEPRLVTAQQRGLVRDDIAAAALARIIAAVMDGFLIQRMADPATDAEAAATTIATLLAPASESSS